MVYEIYQSKLFMTISEFPCNMMHCVHDRDLSSLRISCRMRQLSTWHSCYSCLLGIAATAYLLQLSAQRLSVVVLLSTQCWHTLNDCYKMTLVSDLYLTG